jgi:hypothetical protein
MPDPEDWAGFAGYGLVNPARKSGSGGLAQLSARTTPIGHETPVP